MYGTKRVIIQCFSNIVGLVAAAFASLNNIDTELPPKKPSAKSIKLSHIQQLDGQISKATDINSLLVVAENPIVSRRHALKVLCEDLISSVLHLNLQ